MALYIPGTSYLYESGLDNLVQHARGNGVITGCGVAAHAAPDLGVRVAAGTIQYDGALVPVAQTDLVVGANVSGNSRWDLISVTSAGVPAITQGNPAATPKPPALPANSLVLAIVAVAPAAANVQNANIENRRLISTIGQGIVAGTLANRPTATVQNGMTYFATDDQGGTLYRSNGATWAALGMSAAPTTLTTPNLVLNSDFSRRTVFGLAMPEVFADLSGATKIDAGAAGSVAANIFTQGAANNEYAWCAGSFVWRDGRASATFKAVLAAGVYELRWRISSTDWVAVKCDGANNLVLRKVIASAATNVANIGGMGLTVNRWYWIEIEKQGTTFIVKLYDTGGTVPGVTKASSTLLGTVTGTVADASVQVGAHVSITSDQAAAQWGGIATGNGGVYVETWLPESFSVSFLGTLGGQAVGFDESVDSGSLNKQWAWRAYIPAASRRLFSEQITANGVIVPSVGYTFSGYMKESGQGGTGELAEWQVDGYDAAGVAGPGPTTQIANASATAWTRRTTTWTPASTARRASIVTWINRGLTATGTAYFQTAQLEQGSAATAWRSAEAPAAPPFIIEPAVPPTTDITTTSAAFLDVDPRNLAANIFCPQDSTLDIEFDVTHYNSGANDNSFLITVDGANGGTADAFVRASGATVPVTSVARRRFQVAAGKHRVAVQWKTSAGTATVYASTVNPKLRITVYSGK